MDLIIASGTVPEASRDTMPATGTPGWATDGNPAATIPATDFPAAHYNMVMAEIIQPILDAGLTLDPANWGQLSAAIKALAKQAASDAVLGSLGVLATGDVAGSVLYYSAALGAPAFTYGSTTVGLATTTALTSALGNYLPLGGGNVTGDMDWGDKTKATTLTHRFWVAGPPATGDATPDATLTVTGGTPGTANQGTFKLSTGTFDLSGSGKVLVPDVTDFTTQGALSARVAEGRYVGSVPVAGSGNVRIVSVVADASGNLVATLSDGTTQNYAPGSVGIIPATDTLGAVYWERKGNILRQSFTVIAAYHTLYQPWPFAYKAGTIPVVQALAGSTGNGYVAQVQIAAPQNNISNYVTNAGITLDMPCWAANATAFVSSALPVMLNLTVEGEV